MLIGMTCALPTHASINASADSELVLVLWDPVNRVSYTRDLGINVYAGTDTARRETSFYVNAQQDAGFQQFWSLDPAADANYRQFRSVAVDAGNLVWTVLAVDTAQDPGDGGQEAPGTFQSYMTLRATTTPGVVSQDYARLSSLINSDFALQAPRYSLDFFIPLNGALASDSGTVNPWNTHRPASGGTDYSVNGSSFDAEGQSGYFNKSGAALSTFGSTCACNLTTPVGRSSWFYRVTTSDEFDSFAPVAIDEFDNLSHDGYWGVAVNPANGQLVLSYTLAPATLQSLALTPAGRARAALTEYAAGGISRLIDAPANEFAGYVMPTVSPVPEPGALLLMSGGLLALALGRRRGRGSLSRG